MDESFVSRNYLQISDWYLREQRICGARQGIRASRNVVTKFSFEYDKRYQAFNDGDGVIHIRTEMTTILSNSKVC